MPNNPLYDPPAVLNSTEVNVIGGSLVASLSGEAQQIAWLRSTLKAQQENPDVEWSEDDTVKFKGAMEREMGRLQQHWRIMARFVVDPLPLEMFEKMAEREVNP